jgi:hypothetical protein
MRSVFAVVLAAVAMLVCGCGGDTGSRDRVEAYLRDAAAVQTRSAPTFEAANRAYADFAAGRLEGEAAARRTATIRDDVGATRAALAKLRPPAEARTLHAKLLRVFDLQVALATETAQLAAYVPREQAALAPLPAANRRLRRNLSAAAGHPAGQARGLAAFKASLDRTLRDLRSLTPPPVLRIDHGDRIRALAHTAKLSGRLRAALRAGDAERTADLLDRLDQPSDDRSALAGRAVRDYTRRTRQVGVAMQDVRRAEAALSRRFQSS